VPRVTVVDVGDGACSVLRCACFGPPCRCEVAVLDCGAYKASHQPAMKALRTVLRPDGLFETVKGTGVRPLDLVNTWRERTKITPLPLYREMVFEAVGRQWRVLWPPRELPHTNLPRLSALCRT
jgi:hypothetical protein